MAETNIKDVKLKIGTETQFQSKLKDLPLNTLVGTTDPIQEGELDTSIITKLDKAENALPKPTNDTTGSAGQVLKKTASGSEWGDASSGGGKLYSHKTTLKEDGNTCVIYSLSSVMNPYANASEAIEHIDNGCTVTGRKDNEPGIGWGIMYDNKARWTLSGTTYSIEMSPISFISDSSEEV